METLDLFLTRWTLSLFFFRGKRDMDNCGKCTRTNFPHYRFYFNLVPSILIVFGLLAQLTPFAHSAPYPLRAVLAKRLPLTDASADDGYLEYQSGVRLDEYPIVVPKRAALILDRILKEIELAKDSNQLINDWSPISRRGNNKDKLYFRCYFNAVSCYKRK